MQHLFGKGFLFLFFLLLSISPVNTYYSYFQLLPSTCQIELVFKPSSRTLKACNYINNRYSKSKDPIIYHINYKPYLTAADNTVSTILNVQKEKFLLLKIRILKFYNKFNSIIEDDYFGEVV